MFILPRFPATLLCATLLLVFSSSRAAAEDACAPYTYPEKSQQGPLTQAPVPHSGSLLWKVSKADTTPSHLFGTLHIDSLRLLQLADPVQQAFSASKVLVSELKITPEVMYRFSASLFIQKGDGTPTLSELLPAAIYQRLGELLDKEEVPEMRLVLDRITPWGATLLLSQLLSKPEKAQQSGMTLDLHLQMELASQEDLPVEGLESVQEQLTAFSTLSLEEQLFFLQETICNPDKLREEYASLLESYLAGDLQEIARQGLVAPTYVLNQELLDRFLEELVYQRNKRMAKRLLPYLEQGGAFVAVGALHLPGRGGLVDLLLQAGYTVRPVPLQENRSAKLETKAPQAHQQHAHQQHAHQQHAEQQHAEHPGS